MHNNTPGGKLVVCSLLSATNCQHTLHRTYANVELTDYESSAVYVMQFNHILWRIKGKYNLELRHPFCVCNIRYR